jgi:hypothetical protein
MVDHHRLPSRDRSGPPEEDRPPDGEPSRQERPGRGREPAHGDSRPAYERRCGRLEPHRGR